MNVRVPPSSPSINLQNNPNLCPVLSLNKGPPSLDSVPQAQLHRTDNTLYEDTEHYVRKEKHAIWRKKQDLLHALTLLTNPHKDYDFSKQATSLLQKKLKHNNASYNSEKQLPWVII